MLRFLIDTQPPTKLAEILNQRDCEAVHTMAYAEGPLMKDRRLFDAFRASFTQIQTLFEEGADLVLFEETRLIGY